VQRAFFGNCQDLVILLSTVQQLQYTQDFGFYNGPARERSAENQHIHGVTITAEFLWQQSPRDHTVVSWITQILNNARFALLKLPLYQFSLFKKL